jgi:hypothetical protein
MEMTWPVSPKSPSAKASALAIVLFLYELINFKKKEGKAKE